MTEKPKEKKTSMKYRAHELSSIDVQLDILSDAASVGIKPFSKAMSEMGVDTLKPTSINIFQVNVGKMCNQVCKHCHVDAGPDRQEIMTKETMQQCLDALKGSTIKTVDLTGGAPEMNPHFRWFVTELRALGMHVMVRCNLTIILANKKYHDLPEFFKEHEAEVVSSLPYFAARRTDAQRGKGVFEKSIKALKMLNEVGYGLPDSPLKLNLVFNPSGAFLPGDQAELEKEFKTKLMDGWGIHFHELYAITNLPVSRFLEYLVASGNYEGYMSELAAAFNPKAAIGVMCRNTISVGWDGYLYDCDFNQMLELKVAAEGQHVKDFNLVALEKRNIILNQHCYGCTAGAGSSCGGAVA
jgi:radical SAM/Cys-rich protein